MADKWEKVYTLVSLQISPAFTHVWIRGRQPWRHRGRPRTTVTTTSFLPPGRRFRPPRPRRAAAGDPLPKELGSFSSASEMEVFRAMLAYSAISRGRWPLQVVPSDQRRRRELMFPPLLTQESNAHAARRPTVHAHARQKWRPRIDISLS